jgi:hypothetical protein
MKPCQNILCDNYKSKRSEGRKYPNNCILWYYDTCFIHCEKYKHWNRLTPTIIGAIKAAKEEG